MPKKINSEMVRLAREFRRMTQTELAKRARVPQATISKIETDVQKDLSEELMGDIAKILRFPIGFFFIESNMTGIGSSALYYRRRQKLSAGDMKWIQALVNLLRINLNQMLASVEPHTTLPLAGFDIEEVTPSVAARRLRQMWGMPSGPVIDLTGLVERAGVIVIPCDFGTKHMDATAIWLTESPPIVFINKGLPADRYRWTLAHELAHLVLHAEPRETQEDEADEFAGEFLMPFADIRPYFRTKLSMQVFANLKSVWRVSMAALVRRAFKLRVISQTQYRYYNMHLRRQGFPEPYQFDAETPKAWRELVDFFRDELKYSDEEMKAMFLIDESDYAELYGNSQKTRPRLRLVK